MTYTSKSKRINSIDSGATIECLNGPNNRWARTWKANIPSSYGIRLDEIDWAIDKIFYLFISGLDMKPSDYERVYSNLCDLEEMIRRFADLRKWRHERTW